MDNKRTRTVAPTSNREATDWAERAEHHSREVQAIKKEIRRLSGDRRIFDEYAGIGADRLNSLRYQLEAHEVA